jgi:predicted enzyme related to lactoylglutathione lyase
MADSSAPNVPSWIDLGTPDLGDATRFYTTLFGWNANVSPQPEAGGYTIFTKDAKAVAGAGPLFTEGQPPAWSMYVSTDDANGAARRVEAAGGVVLMPPFDVLDQGRMAVFVDPTGAPFSVWQPIEMGGAELFNVPGALCWTELITRDPEGAKAFYGAVFGWGVKDNVFGPVTYTEWLVNGVSVAGMMPMVGEQWAPDLPPHWMVYFAVNDCDATASHAAELGGTVSVAPTDIPQGRIAVINDPQGASFSVIRMAQT